MYPPPLSKHSQGQKNNGHTRSSRLDKPDSIGLQYQSECWCGQEEPSQTDPARLAPYNQRAITERRSSDHTKPWSEKPIKNNGHTGSSRLDKPKLGQAVLGHRTVECSAIGPHRQTYALIRQVSRSGAATHMARDVQCLCLDKGGGGIPTQKGGVACISHVPKPRRAKQTHDPV